MRVQVFNKFLFKLFLKTELNKSVGVEDDDYFCLLDHNLFKCLMFSLRSVCSPHNKYAANNDGEGIRFVMSSHSISLAICRLK